MRNLSAQFPGLHSALPFVRLADLPTELRCLDNLGTELGITGLLIKSDDTSAAEYGGNKVRKLEYLLGDALARNCDAVLTYGMVGSNHALATAIHAKRLGLRCYAVLIGQLMTTSVQMTLRYHAHVGTHLIHATDFPASRELAARARAAHPGGEERVYEIPWGGSSWLGTVGLIGAALELSVQLRDAGHPEPDFIYMPCGTLGSTVGLAMGLRLAGLASRVVAVRVTPPVVSSPERFADLFNETNAELHARDPDFPVLDDPLANIMFRDEFFGAEHDYAGVEIRAARELMRTHENIHLDMTYTGKAMAALIHDARQGQLAGRNALFWNTYNFRPYPENLPARPGRALPTEFDGYFPEAGRSGAKP